MGKIFLRLTKKMELMMFSKKSGGENIFTLKKGRPGRVDWLEYRIVTEGPLALHWRAWDSLKGHEMHWRSRLLKGHWVALHWRATRCIEDPGYWRATELHCIGGSLSYIALEIHWRSTRCIEDPDYWRATELHCMGHEMYWRATGAITIILES